MRKALLAAMAVVLLASCQTDQLNDPVVREAMRLQNNVRGE